MIILTGISGSGKTTVGKTLENKGYKKIITTTTRNKREGEVDGKDYYFVTKEEFEKNKEAYRFITEYAGDFYGLNQKELIDCSKKYMILDSKGAIEIKKELQNENIEIVFLYITIEEMIKRLKKRGENNDTINKRLEVALNSEIFFTAYDHIIINMEEQFNKMEEQIDILLKKIEG